MNRPPFASAASPPRRRSHAGRIARGAASMLGLGLALLVPACGRQQAPAPPPAPVVEILEVTKTNVPLSGEVIGQLDSPQNVEVRARVEAFVKEVLFTEGTNVNEKDPLFVLEKAPFQEKLAAARGQLAQAEAVLAKYRADVVRLEPLAEKKAIPLQDLENAQASVEVGKANVLSAQAVVDSALLDLSYCSVDAPVSGLIGAKQVSIGELVGKGQPTLLATISTLDPIWVYCSVSEVDYLRAEAKIRATGRRFRDIPVSLILADGSVHPHPGQIVFIDRAVDPKTGTLRSRSQFPNPRGLLRPGMFARLRLDLGVRADSIVVPERAIAELQGRTFVWVVGEGNQASQRAVRVGEAVAGGVVVEEGLTAGERIIVEGVHKVREGAVVQPVTAAERAAASPVAAANPAGANPSRGKE